MVVLSGQDKGRRGAVLQVLPQARVLVESVNRVKRHTKPNPQANEPGGIIEKEMPLPLAKVAIWNPARQEGRPRRHQARWRTARRCVSSSRTAK